ncbi:poly(R)-hydroxyalkanoic acid synthase subunit PhaE [Rhodanobacter lindaniclasticus]
MLGAVRLGRPADARRANRAIAELATERRQAAIGLEGVRPATSRGHAAVKGARGAYGEMVNTQMRVRQLQQQQTEQMCRQLGVPTRSEVSSLGERLQALRREFRASQAGAGGDHADEIMALRREIAALKRQLGDRPVTRPVATKAAPARSSAPAKKAAPAKKSAAKSTRKPAAASRSTASARKRK